ENLLRRYVGSGSRRKAVLFREQIREVRVIGKTEVDEYDIAIGLDDDVVRLEIEMNSVLKMQAVHRIGDCGPDRSHIVGRKRTTLDHLLQTFAVDPLGDKVRRLRQVSHGNESGNMRSRE